MVVVGVSVAVGVGVEVGVGVGVEAGVGVAAAVCGSPGVDVGATTATVADSFAPPKLTVMVFAPVLSNCWVNVVD